MESRSRRVGLAAAAITIGLTGLGTATPASADRQALFERLATYPVFQNRPAGTPAEDETVAEISTVSEDGRTLIYTDAPGGRVGFLDISDPKRPRGKGTIQLGAGEEPTSVAVVGPYVLVVVDTSPSFTAPSGRVDVIRIADRVKVRSLDLGGQPDSIAVSGDRRYAAIVIENERDEEATPPGGDEGDLPQAPGGLLRILDLTGRSPASWGLRTVPFTGSGGAALPSFVQAGLDTPQDPEPEYVTINDDNRAAVTLQENNGIAIVDLRTGRIERVFSAGKVTVTGIDIDNDGSYDPTGKIEDTPREPDAIAWIDRHTLATANEGDWKGGTRGWTVFSDTGRVLWDAGNSFEHLAARYGHFNDDRADNKGTEPEGLAVATFKGRRYAFVGSERSNFVAVYDVSRPTRPEFVQFLPTNAGPEGLLPVPSRGLLLVSSENDDASIGMRAGVQAFGLGRPEVPGLVARDPIGWGALSGLSPVPGDRRGLYAVSDAVFTPTRIFRIDTGRTPAMITRTLTVTRNGTPAGYDIEGIIARPHGGFWLAAEGDAAAENPLATRNLLVLLDDRGAVRQEVPLPADIAAKVGKQGLEGVTVTGTGKDEEVWTILQRALPGDPADVVRIGRYRPATGTWAWYGYTLEKSASAANWNGVSELVVVGDRLAVVERDKASGTDAAHKKIYSVPLPGGTPAPGTLPVLPKRLVRDLLPDLRGFGGHVQEKVEGLAVAGDGRVWVVTDNDGFVDATGETVFYSPGTARGLFGR
ncbi:alkaline phosphatase [Actinomadura craniellae]|uniref:Alkaline phosphatase n=1 Tax=Actinomadura craniellae TaxID=2231787 RepID=A0A365GXU8_9ACTN|nr:esterase-like activity of phytase family protein [Actinomadura craniellae]RAY11650.1 alkaline phosphatase [Actinomadura craniellae]